MDLPLMNESAAEGSYGWAGRAGGGGESPGGTLYFIVWSRYRLDNSLDKMAFFWPYYSRLICRGNLPRSGKRRPREGSKGGRKGGGTRGARELLIRDLHIKLTDLSPTPEHRRAIRPYFLSPHLAPNADDRLILASMFASDVVFRSD